MANIRVDVDYTIIDGSEIVFRSPVDCSAITGLIVYYIANDGAAVSKVFAFADAHGNNVGDIDHLFAEDVVVKVILDVTKSMAFVQNADTNAYLEMRFDGKVDTGFGYGETLATVSGSTEAELETNLTAIINGMANYTTKQVKCSLSFLEISTFSLATIYRHTSKYAEVVIETVSGTTLKKVYADAWQPIVWVNPPMVGNVEYLTANRIGGNSVYNKLNPDTGYLQYRREGSETWHSYNTLIGSAPAGYGYGEVPVSLGNANDDKDTTFIEKLDEQFAKTTSRTRMVTFTRNGNGWIGELWAAGNGYGSLTAYCYNGDNSAFHAMMIRSCRNGVWQPWEYENPPLKAGTEYRTTERTNGKPVYVKRISHGTLAASGSTVTIRTDITDSISLIDFNMLVTLSSGNIMSFPTHSLYDATHGLTGYFDPANKSFVVQTHADYSKATAVVTLKYVKS